MSSVYQIPLPLSGNCTKLFFDDYLSTCFYKFFRCFERCLSEHQTKHPIYNYNMFNGNLIRLSVK